MSVDALGFVPFNLPIAEPSFPPGVVLMSETRKSNFDCIDAIVTLIGWALELLEV